MSTRKKILFLITKATWGGAQRYVYDLIRSLPQNEFSPALAYGVEGRLSELLRNDGVRTRRISSLSRDVAFFSDLKSFIDMLRMFRNARPEVVHLNSSKAAALGALAARIAGVPLIVFTAHGWPFKEDRNPLARALIYLLSVLTAMLSHRVIVVSRVDERLGKSMWFAGKKISYIPLGMETPHFRTPHDAFREMFGTHTPATLAPETVRLVSLAELTKNKGIIDAIDAVAHLKERGIDAIYVVAGTGEERAALERAMRERGIVDRVFLVGFIEYAALNLSGFDIFVLPSIKEGTPYALLEAAAAGLPIVATDAIDAELARSIDYLKIVPARNALAIADAIAEFAKRNRVKTPRNAFPLNTMTEQTIELYRS